MSGNLKVIGGLEHEDATCYAVNPKQRLMVTANNKDLKLWYYPNLRLVDKLVFNDPIKKVSFMSEENIIVVQVKHCHYLVSYNDASSHSTSQIIVKNNKVFEISSSEYFAMEQEQEADDFEIDSPELVSLLDTYEKDLNCIYDKLHQSTHVNVLGEVFTLHDVLSKNVTGHFHSYLFDSSGVHKKIKVELEIGGDFKEMWFQYEKNVDGLDEIEKKLELFYENCQLSPIETPVIYKTYRIAQDELIILKYGLSGRTLQDILDFNGPIAEKAIWNILRQVYDVLRFVWREDCLMSRCLMLKAHNIFISESGQICFANFPYDFPRKRAYCQSIDVFELRSIVPLPPDREYSFLTDILELATLLYKLVTGEFVCENKKNELIYCFEEKLVDFSKTEHVSKPLQDFLKKSLQDDATKRFAGNKKEFCRFFYNFIKQNSES